MIIRVPSSCEIVIKTADDRSVWYKLKPNDRLNLEYEILEIRFISVK